MRRRGLNGYVSCSNREMTVNSYNQGMKALEEKDYALAIACFTEAIQLDPQNAKAYYNRGNAHGNSGAYDQALADIGNYWYK